MNLTLFGSIGQLAIARSLFGFGLLLAFGATEALARCSPGNGDCLTLSSDHPASQALGPLMTVAILGGLAAALGVGAAVTSKHLDTEGDADAISQFKMIIALWRNPSISPFVKTLIFGGAAAGLGSFLIGMLLLWTYGSYI